jgi:hypothetical protein
MARAITKSFGSTNVTLIIRRVVVENGQRQIVTESYTFEGTRSVAGAKAALTKQLKTSNFMVVDSSVESGSDIRKYTMDVDSFVALADMCEEDVSYGHDTITATIKVTQAGYITMDSMDEKTYTMVGTTTERKLRNAIAKEINDENILVTDIHIGEVRMWMTKDKFVKYAKEC